MLCSLESILTKALQEKYAVPQFNINNLEWTKYILEECQNKRTAVILGVSEGAINYMGGYNVVYNLVNSMINDLNITIPVVLHLDHGSSVESCKKAIDANFTSVMIDASHLELEKNIKLVKEICEYANKYNVSVEAEIGTIGGVEDNLISNTYFAKVEDCIKLYNETKVTAIAPALGSKHGLYTDKPNINFKRMKEISESLNIPLVLHGASGLTDEDIIQAIRCGVSKININTDLQIAWSKGIKEYLNNNNNAYDPRKIISSGEENLKNMVSNKLHLLGCCNKI